MIEINKTSYFKPKLVESYRNQTIYEFVGVKLYKKYLPFTGDIVRKRKNTTQIKLNKKVRIDELYRYERKTRRNELTHVFGLVLCVGLILIYRKQFSCIDLAFIILLNLYLNIYPIFLQRHNRIRIIKVLLNNGQKSPYDN